MTMVGLPLILFQVGGAKDMGDLEYLSIKEFGGKLRTAKGSNSATGDLATLTANTGKDMYIARAKCVFYTDNDTGFSNSVGDKVVLKLNGSIIETSAFTAFNDPGNGDASGNSVINYEFKNMGHFVLAGQIIKLEVTVLDANTSVEGFISCFEENTGTTPAV